MWQICARRDSQTWKRVPRSENRKKGSDNDVDDWTYSERARAISK